MRKYFILRKSNISCHNWIIIRVLITGGDYKYKAFTHLLMNCDNITFIVIRYTHLIMSQTSNDQPKLITNVDNKKLSIKLNQQHEE